MMKKIIFSAMVLAVAAVYGAELPDPPHMPRRAPKIFKTGKNVVRLTPERTAIVTASDAVPAVRFAARELSTFLSRSLGGKVGIFNAPQKGKFNISLVRSPLRRSTC